MKSIAGTLAIGLTLTLGANHALAQQDDPGDDADLDVTISVISENADLPVAVTRELTLPLDDEEIPIPSDAGVANSARGLETANSARADGRAFGEAAAAAAEANREQLGRGSPPALEDLVPADVPVDLTEIPGSRPDVPTPGE